MSVKATDTSRPAPRTAIVRERPISSMRNPPSRNPLMLPTIATFETQAPAVARTRVGKSSARNAPSAGVSIVVPSVARKIEAARNQPDSSR
jgi:hypothetical protein